MSFLYLFRSFVGVSNFCILVILLLNLPPRPGSFFFLCYHFSSLVISFLFFYLVLVLFCPSSYSPPEPPPVEGPPSVKKPSILVPPPPPPPVAPLPSAIDLVVHFDVDDETVARRAYGRRLDPASNKEYHVETQPPPDSQPVKVSEALHSFSPSFFILLTPSFHFGVSPLVSCSLCIFLYSPCFFVACCFLLFAVGFDFLLSFSVRVL